MQLGGIGGTALAVTERHVLKVRLYVQNLEIGIDRQADIDRVDRITGFTRSAFTIDKPKAFLINKLKLDFNGAIVALEALDRQRPEVVLSALLCGRGKNDGISCRLAADTRIEYPLVQDTVEAGLKSGINWPSGAGLYTTSTRSPMRSKSASHSVMLVSMLTPSSSVTQADT